MAGVQVGVTTGMLNKPPEPPPTAVADKRQAMRYGAFRKYASTVGANDRFAVLYFTGGNVELAAFLNAMPANWKMLTVTLATSPAYSPVALFEIKTAK